MERIILNTNNLTSVNFLVTYRYVDKSEYNVDLQFLDKIIGCRYDMYKANFGLLTGSDGTKVLSLKSKSDGIIDNFSVAPGLIDADGTLDWPEDVNGSIDGMNYLVTELNKSDRYVVMDMIEVYTDEAIKSSDDYIVQFKLNSELILVQTKIRTMPLAQPRLYDGKLYTHICQLPVFSANALKKSDRLIAKMILANNDIGPYFKNPKTFKFELLKKNGISVADTEQTTYSKVYESNSFEAIETSSVGLDIYVPADCDYIAIKPVAKIPSQESSISLYSYLFPMDDPDGEEDYREVPEIDYDITVTELYVDNGPDVNMALDPYERTIKEVTRRLTIHTDVSEEIVPFRPVLKHSTSAIYFDVNVVATFTLDDVEYKVEGSVMDNKPRKYGEKMVRLGFPGVYNKVNVFNKRINDSETSNIVFNNTVVNIDASQVDGVNTQPVVEQTIIKGFVQTNRIVVNASNIIAQANIITEEEQ